jgi:hypothetical protein
MSNGDDLSWMTGEMFQQKKQQQQQFPIIQGQVARIIGRDPAPGISLLPEVNPHGLSQQTMRNEMNLIEDLKRTDPQRAAMLEAQWKARLYQEFERRREQKRIKEEKEAEEKRKREAKKAEEQRIQEEQKAEAKRRQEQEKKRKEAEILERDAKIFEEARKDAEERQYNEWLRQENLRKQQAFAQQEMRRRQQQMEEARKQKEEEERKIFEELEDIEPAFTKKEISEEDFDGVSLSEALMNYQQKKAAEEKELDDELAMYEELNKNKGGRGRRKTAKRRPHKKIEKKS